MKTGKRKRKKKIAEKNQTEASVKEEVRARGGFRTAQIV